MQQKNYINIAGLIYKSGRLASPEHRRMILRYKEITEGLYNRVAGIAKQFNESKAQIDRNCEAIYNGDRPEKRRMGAGIILPDERYLYIRADGDRTAAIIIDNLNHRPDVYFSLSDLQKINTDQARIQVRIENMRRDHEYDRIQHIRGYDINDVGDTMMKLSGIKNPADIDEIIRTRDELIEEEL